MTKVTVRKLAHGALCVLALLAIGGLRDAPAHCDTMDGPVIQAARHALESGDITPVLAWIREPDEPAVRNAFDATRNVRRLNGEARELADQYFFETLVRLHRAGEGAPYDGLKPAGAVHPAIAAADQALASGSIDALSKDMSTSLANALRQRFEEAREKKAHSEESVAAGRDFVAAYVEYVHFVEGLTDLMEAGAHGSENSAQPGGHIH